MDIRSGQGQSDNNYVRSLALGHMTLDIVVVAQVSWPLLYSSDHLISIGISCYGHAIGIEWMCNCEADFNRYAITERMLCWG